MAVYLSKMVATMVGPRPMRSLTFVIPYLLYQIDNRLPLNHRAKQIPFILFYFIYLLLLFLNKGT